MPGISLSDPGSVTSFLRRTPVKFTFVSHIDALTAGLADVLAAHGYPVIGPTRGAALLESSKVFGRDFCRRSELPTARASAFTNPAAARAFVRSAPFRCVVKDDAIAANGDGTTVCDSVAEAEAAIDSLAGRGEDFRVLIEERLDGQELSAFALTDGRNCLVLPTALDFKLSDEGQQGTNCDGMGSVAPHPAETPALREQLRRDLFEPFVAGVRRENLGFTGFINLGVMMTAGGLRILDVNASFGDSGAEVVLPGIQSDFAQICDAVLRQDLGGSRLATDGRPRCSIALTQGCLDPDDPGAAVGWPHGAFAAGQPVTGLASAQQVARVFYAGIARGAFDGAVTAGGRVLHVVGEGDSPEQARERAYAAAELIDFAGKRLRRDIGTATTAATAAAANAATAGAGAAAHAVPGNSAAAESGAGPYSCSFPVVFTRGKNEWLQDAEGGAHLDFFSGAGALNYGHNPDALKTPLLEYIAADGLAHGLDLATRAKRDFLSAFGQHILRPRELEYLVQFCSPSGTSAAEAAVQLARLVTGRSTVAAFAGGFQGMSTGAPALTWSPPRREGPCGWLPSGLRIPFPDSPAGPFDSLGLLTRLVEDPGSGVELPAAVVLETIQAEGGIYCAPEEFIRDLRRLCDRHGMLLIVDDVQTGCGRTGDFFSFERAGIRPDIVTLSKSVSGYGLPMAVLLIRPDLDAWRPGQHSGTFRGHQLAFVTAAAAIRAYWADSRLSGEIQRKGDIVAAYLREHFAVPGLAAVRGRGLMWGIDLGRWGASCASAVSLRCFDRGLVAETCGRDGEVLKLLPPLTITDRNLRLGLDIIAAACADVIPAHAASANGEHASAALAEA